MSQIDNAFYEDLNEKWYEEEAHPVALLRAENATRNPWILKKIEELLGTSCTILDIGCGAGFLTNTLAKAGHRVTGIDSSESSLNIAKIRDETHSVEYLQKDAFSMDYAQGSFDVICAMDFLEHIEEPERIVQMVSSFLRPGGLFFFHTFNRNILSWLMVIKAVEWLVPNTPKNMHVYPLFIKPKELEGWLKAEGLEVQEIRGLTPHFCSTGFLRSLIKRRIRPDFRFTFTPSLLIGYVGVAVKQK